ncbi:hypothetical protein EJ03DRAFT_76916 [Teratosphaeria nubilosa]|uniref:Uncharacterized protein n=1 Tax=Teratosphaeria nubilosa TaxID=161662 RepID=A0A6G1LCS3_9PEZI|nr:hypothetical protein EJ03DRAFT_76916 [Teratosphaeria nubilosa]
MGKHNRLQVILYALGLLVLESRCVGHGQDRSTKQARCCGSQTPCFTYDELWKMHKTFWNMHMYPNNVEAAKSINSTIFAENVIGRVEQTREFLGRELNTEYIFGLFTGVALNPGAIEILGRPVAYDIIHFAATDYVTSSAVVVTYNHSSYLSPLEIDSFITWNSHKQITQYDVTFRRSDHSLDLTFARFQRTIGASSLAQTLNVMTQALAQSVCTAHDRYCDGTNQQYESRDVCMKFLTQEIRFGKVYEQGRNTLLCRVLHQYMVAYRPQVHCPHLGPSGGDMCVDDKDYESIVREKLYTNAPFVPRGKVDASIAVQ